MVMLNWLLSFSPSGMGSRASIRAKGGRSMAAERFEQPGSRREDRSSERRDLDGLAERGSSQSRDRAARRPSEAVNGGPSPGRPCDMEEHELLAAVAARDEEACNHLIWLHHDGMVRLARGFVRSRELAEEVVQETWMAAFRGLREFEGRSSFKTWLFGILIRQARAAGAREHRTAPFSQLVRSPSEEECDPMEAFFHDEGHPDAGGWAVPPQRWRRNPEDMALDAEMRRVVEEAIVELPEAQGVVVTLRDGEGWETEEVATLLDRTPNWVRVTLHRGRAKVRLAVVDRLGAREARG